MTSAREANKNPGRELPKGPQVAPVDPNEWVKPVELIELLQRRTAKHKRPKAPTSSPFYDAEFVAKHQKRGRAQGD